MLYYYSIHVLMRDEKEGGKKQARSNKQQSKAKQHSKAVTFPKKNERTQNPQHSTLQTVYIVGFQCTCEA